MYCFQKNKTLEDFRRDVTTNESDILPSEFCIGTSHVAYEGLASLVLLHDL